MAKPPTTSRARVGWVLFLGCLAAYALSSRGYISVIDVQLRYETAIQIHDSGTIVASPEQLEGKGKQAYFPNSQGEYHSIYSLGQSITMLPCLVVADLVALLGNPEQQEETRYLAGQFIFMTLMRPAIAALGVLAFFLLCGNLGLTTRMAIWAALAFGFGTYFWSYVRTGLHNMELTSWMLLGLATYTGGHKTPLRLFVAATFLSFTFHYRPEALLPIGLTYMIMCAALYRTEAPRLARWLALTTPLFVSGCLVLVHNHVRFGRLGSVYEESTCGYPLWSDTPADYLWYVTFGLNGLFWYSPVLLIGFALFRQRPKWSPFIKWSLLPVAVFTLFVASLFRTRLDWSWGPRFMVPLVPFLVLYIAYGLQPLVERSRGFRLSAAVFVMLCLPLQSMLSFERHDVEIQQMILVGGQEGMRGHSTLISRLRNLGLPLGEPEVTNRWQDEDVQALRTPFADNLSWLKFASKVGNPKLTVAITTVAVAASILTLAVLLQLMLSREPGVFHLRRRFAALTPAHWSRRRVASRGT